MKGTKTLLSYILFVVGIQYKVICRLPPKVCEKDYFTCANKDCIPKFWKCDNSDDCGDNSDESDCPVSSAHECDADEMKCNNGRCITIEWRCDSEDDCGDNTDETNCPATHQTRPCDGSTNFRCDNGKCIPRSWTCNSIDDCGDNSDESTDADPYCVPFTGCKEGYFQCNTTGLCIHNILVCDHNYNCGVDKKGVKDESDEAYCAQRTCEPGEYKCDNGRCISEQWKCDKQNDCGDGSDERNCSIKSCKDDQFKCKSSGHCISGNYRCDNFSDCLDGSDESQCPSYTNNSTKSVTTTPVTMPVTTKAPFTLVTTRNTTMKPTKTYIPVFSCLKGQYKCKNENKCLSPSWVCDGETDCSGNDDESVETCSTSKCESNHFRCKNKKCVDEKNQCDGHNHCGDNSDELNCQDAQVPCSGGSSETFKCKGSHKCIKKSSVCDQRKDCPLDDDEDPSCGINECANNNGNCSSICTDLPIGYKCECPKGYEMDPSGKKCVDINECHLFGKCSQACVNYKGSFACECDKGYSMDPLDNRTCHADGPTPYLFYTNRYDIRKISSNGLITKMVNKNARSSVALAVSYKEKMLYWADIGLKTISRMLINNESGKEEIIVRDVGKPEDLALDSAGKKLYWTNTDLNQVSVSNLDGTHKKVLYQGGDHEAIRAVEVYPEKGFIFWTNMGGHPKIERGNLDGSNKTTIVSRGLTAPTHIAIDKTNDRLYWTEKSSICTVKIDGSGYKQIIENLSRPYGIAVFEDSVYWTDFSERSMYKANKFNGKNKQKINGSFRAPLDVAVFHPLMEDTVSHPCKGKNGGCSHLCFMKPDRKSVCACPGVMELKEDMKTCLEPTSAKVSTGKLITTKVPDTTEGKKVFTKKPITEAPEVKTTVITTSKPEIKSTKPATEIVATRAPETTTKLVVVKTTIAATESKTIEIVTAEPVVIVNHQVQEQQDEDKSDDTTKTVYIVVGVVCLIGTVMFIVFGVICFRKKRRQFELSMVYESQRDVVHKKDLEKPDVEKKYVIANKKSKAFDNVNFKNSDGAVHIPVNMEDDMMDDISDNSSSDICFDDRAPIMSNML